MSTRAFCCRHWLASTCLLENPVFDSVDRMINIKGSYVSNRQDGEEAIDFFARGLINAPFKMAPLEDLPRIFQLMGLLLPSRFESC